jgi:anti-sigma regulatory factor (Ser/Thr protein kinase)
VPLNRPAEPLAPGPLGATQARRWVSSVCEEIGRGDLVENAALALSEVVTNAILHGRPPVTVRLRGTRDHPRVEVRDQSPQPPIPPQAELEHEYHFELATFGRGLSIVANSSEAWGAERDGEGKMVWFEPAVDAPDVASDGVFVGFDDDADEPAFEGVHSIVVHLLNVPTEAMQATLAHGAELRRELRLLAVAHHDTYPVASDLSTFFSALARDFRLQMGGEVLREALVAGRRRLDLDVKASVEAGARFARLIELYELADAFCRNERLLTLARSPEQVEFQTWMFTEFVRQAAGEEPLPWRGDGRARMSKAQP